MNDSVLQLAIRFWKAKVGSTEGQTLSDANTQRRLFWGVYESKG